MNNVSPQESHQQSARSTKCPPEKSQQEAAGCPPATEEPDQPRKENFPSTSADAPR